ncbi:MAG: hypothetical protein VX205_07845 [Pseudomonadota bacterium]|jgi:hypothetical protein|nr:hypothetical protein [Sphingobium sp.]MCC4251805.1 hypothetical protein [Sphingobium naphthae]MEC7931709.1 hypothetical protein [Pseudomonadota bacterium]MEC8034890.1 hypothetical protein [Pseudomonadota bacterium]PDH68352.1 MAG: hypothetical protein CNE89_04180 [Sphingomonadaceae bacterium MED-G03]
MDGSIWSLAVIGGPVLLGLVLIFVIISNKRRKDPRDIARTEQATDELYRKMDAEDKASGSG